MNYYNIKICTCTLFAFVFLGCSVNQDMLKSEETEIKKVEYERPAISMLLKNRIREILNTMSKNDLSKLNKEYIHPKFGFFNLYKINGTEIFLQQDKIYNILEEQTDELSHIISRVNPDDSKLKIIEKNIKFDCSPNDDAFYGWNGEGLYLSNKMDISLSSMMKKLDTYTESEYKKALKIEETSYKIVLTPELTFYLSKIDNNWYITLVDRITTDCSS